MGLIVRILVVVIVATLAAATWDFVSFVDRADRAIPAAASLDAATPAADPIQADGVTALTGASNARIKAGVEIANELRVPLLISGVHIDTSAADIAAIVGVRETEIRCCVTLGRAAATTEGNGAEVAEWARRHRMTRLVVVTSEYHMDRALIELRRAMPEGEFVPYAVQTTHVRPRDWYRDSATAKRLFEEWMKFRVASVRAARDTASIPAPSPDASPTGLPASDESAPGQLPAMNEIRFNALGMLDDSE